MKLIRAKKTKRCLAILASLAVITSTSALKSFAFNADNTEIISKEEQSTTTSESDRLDLNKDGTVNIVDFILLKSVILDPENASQIIDTTENNFTAMDLIDTTKILLGIPTQQPPTAEWKNPEKTDLVHTDFLHNEDLISNDTYEMLVNAAKAYGYDNYEIIWSNTPIPYAYTNPGLFYCMMNGIAYGYAVQVIPGEDIQTASTGLSKLVTSELSLNNFNCFRPLTSDDSAENVIENFENSEATYKDKSNLIFCGIEDFNEGSEDLSFFDLYFENEYNPFEFANWYLIPVNENGERILEANINTPNYEELKIPNSNYWFTQEELTPDGYVVSRHEFNMHLFTANYYGFKNFRLESSEDFLYGGYIVGGLNNSNLYGSCKMISPENFLEYWPDMEKYLEEKGESANGVEYDLSTYMDVEKVKFYAYVPKSFEIQPFDRTTLNYGFSAEDFIFPNALNYGYNEFSPRLSYMFEVE